MPPHVYAVAESAYYNMNAYKDNQCIIISGESGAGKTEAAKRIMQYIANVSGSGSSSIQEIKDMVLATNPLLESFGCAKTLRNNNSSRHGKYLEIQFNAQGEPVGANITNYLLEKGRVVGQIEQERNFHIFYQFAKGASQKYREQYGIQTPETYLYTSRSKCFDVPGIDDIADYADTIKAMNIIGLTQHEQDEIFRMLAIILWLGNVVFREDDQGNATIGDPSVADFIAYLMGTDGAAVNKALTIRIMETSRGGRRGSVYEVPLNPTQASAVRDALAKAIYNNLFEWIVSRVNVSMATRSSVAQTIGILDIYGFEIFEKNSFEQICINYVNEKLQQIFIQLTLRTEQEEYAREQITWTPITYFDNKIVCDLIEEKRPPGVFAALNDACATAHADSGAADGTFVQRLNMLSSNKHFENRQGQFLIKHYAGDVMYQVEGMTDKNKDQLLKDLLDLVEGSGSEFLHALFPQQVDRDNKRRPPTASDKIKASANDLVTTLMKAQPSYIRTIKPNENKSPKEYNQQNVLHQIKYLGLQENVRIRRAGFAYRQTFEKFVERFYLLSPRTSYAGDYTWTGDARSGTEVILKDTSIPKEEWQMGVTKAFIKTPETLFALEHMRDRYWHNMAIRIQRAWRNYLRYRAECATRIQRCWRRKKGGLEYLQLRDQGHKVLGQRKERRRMSILGSRRFLGDYLGVGNDGGPGQRVREAAKIGGLEQVLFSCRSELLVSKLGRSSKPSPRILVLTNKAIHIIIQSSVQGQLEIRTERCIPLGSLKFVGMTNLRDDWMSFGVGSPQEPDPLLSCIFKTEFVTHLKIALHGSLDLRIGPAIEYAKKPGKMATVKAVKDPNVPRDDLYKSGAIHVGQGEAPNSISAPTPKGKQLPPKAITTGKLLRPGGPGGKKSSYVPKPTPAARPLPGQAEVHSVRKDAASTVPSNISSIASAAASHLRSQSNTSQTSTAKGRPAPPPPPAPPAAIAEPKEPQYRALYDYVGQTVGELTILKDEIILVVQKENNGIYCNSSPTPHQPNFTDDEPYLGWWLAKKLAPPQTQGWAPSAYLKEEPKAAPPPPPPPPPAQPPRPANGSLRAGKAAPPPPPAKRPNMAGKGKPPVPGRNITPTTNGAATEQGSGAGQGGGLAGGLAEALRSRQMAMRGKGDDDDDDW
ncbi:P-loop containing nucleoside triphosphate hydrolase protein [Terfezia claveryi]|nr:P-loop containing nucleoside triphosphate hydrolase protein [Terfezia claveryi]